MTSYPSASQPPTHRASANRPLDRTDTGLLARWWWTLDRPTYLALLFLMGFSAILVVAASPAVAQRIGLDAYFFVRRQHVYLLLGLAVITLVSMASPRMVRRIGGVAFLGAFLLLCLVPLVGHEYKGAQRWMTLAGVSVQPSEFIKPTLAIVMAWAFTERLRGGRAPSFRIATVLYALVSALLLMQPDVGMWLTVSAIWGAQLFVGGLPLLVCAVLALGGCVALYGAYLVMPHVANRINTFLSPESGDTYQVEKSLAAFQNGGLFGMGPGEGAVKQFIPDAHTDYVFAVMGEEFGLLVCLLALGVYGFIVLRGMRRAVAAADPFALVAVTGLLTQFGFQALVNMGVAVNLLPAKGMTLPLLSYGGSSTLAAALGMGMVLALTRKRYGLSPH